MQRRILDSIDLQTLGRELQRARKQKGLRQEDAAIIIDVARTTMIDIEAGRRKPKASELIKLAQAYGRQVHDLLRQRPEIGSFAKAQFRGPAMPSPEDEELREQSILLFEEYCRKYAELEYVTESKLSHNYPPEYTPTGSDLETAAETLAINERERLGLGDGPISVLRDVLEQEVGIRIFYLPLPLRKLSAIYYYNNTIGACIAINSDHPEERCRWSLAHDYSHFLRDRSKPTVLFEQGYQRYPESERFADAFATQFLMPTAGLERRFEEIRSHKGTVTPADLCILANYYGVSVEAITRRLENIGSLKTGTWDRIKEGGFKIEETKKFLGLSTIPARRDTFPLQYQYLAVEAFTKGLIGEAQVASFLDVDRYEARQILIGLNDTITPLPTTSAEQMRKQTMQGEDGGPND